MINSVTLLGNLGRDPEIRSTQSGVAIANLSLATNRRWKDRSDGGTREETEWHRIVCFGRQAEIAAEFLTKGRQIYLEGRLRTNSWEDQETGQTRHMTEVVCGKLQMLGGRPDGGAESTTTYTGADHAVDPEDDDIPF